MVTTTRVRLDRISSSTKNAHLATEVIVGPEILAAEGYVLAVRILADKSSYNTVEDLSGRMVSLRKGDVLAGTLGSRRALRGYAGEVPSHVAVGDTIDVLNLGGILGRCTSANPDIGPPFPRRSARCGARLPGTRRPDRPAGPHPRRLDRRQRQAGLRRAGGLRGRHLHERGQDGRRHGAGARALARAGYRVAAAKLTGVSLMRDTLSMQDAGAVAAVTFNDAGAASTRAGMTVPVARGLFNRLDETRART